jgi:diadenosine tetraphosphate (Ap4A) HIT family hydrolase
METCPYCKHILVAGSSTSVVPRSAFDQIVSEGPGVVVTPTLGMIVPGYLLMITVTHAINYGSLEAAVLGEIEAYLRALLERLAPLFGEYLIFEHGPAGDGQRHGHGGCIDHAHFHLIPVAERAGGRVLAALPFREIDGLSDLRGATNQGYALLGLKNHFFLATQTELPSQWIRRIVAESIATERHWDWGADFGYAELRNTIAAIQSSGALARPPESS